MNCSTVKRLSSLNGASASHVYCLEIASRSVSSTWKTTTRAASKLANRRAPDHQAQFSRIAGPRRNRFVDRENELHDPTFLQSGQLPLISEISARRVSLRGQFHSTNPGVQSRAASDLVKQG